MKSHYFDAPWYICFPRAFHSTVEILQLLITLWNGNIKIWSTNHWQDIWQICPTYQFLICCIDPLIRCRWHIAHLDVVGSQWCLCARHDKKVKINQKGAMNLLSYCFSVNTRKISLYYAVDELSCWHQKTISLKVLVKI